MSHTLGSEAGRWALYTLHCWKRFYPELKPKDPNKAADLFIRNPTAKDIFWVGVGRGFAFFTSIAAAILTLTKPLGFS